MRAGLRRGGPSGSSNSASGPAGRRRRSTGACYLAGKRHRPIGREVASAAAALPAPTAARVTSIRAGRRQCPAVVRLRGCRMRRLLERLPPGQPLRLRHPSSSPSQLREQLIERCRPRQLPQSATPAHTGPTPRRTARNRNAPERSTAAEDQRPSPPLSLGALTSALGQGEVPAGLCGLMIRVISTALGGVGDLWPTGPMGGVVETYAHEDESGQGVAGALLGAVPGVAGGGAGGAVVAVFVGVGTVGATDVPVGSGRDRRPAVTALGPDVHEGRAYCGRLALYALRKMSPHVGEGTDSRAARTVSVWRTSVPSRRSWRLVWPPL